MNKQRRRICLGLTGSLATSTIGSASAQEARSAYPVRPVRLIVPFAAGGATDFFARRVTEDLRAAFNQTFIIENRPGAGAMLGTALAAKAAPDGYSLLFMTNSLCLQEAINPPGKGYVLASDFVAVAPLYSLDIVLAVNADLPVKSVGELVAYAKANPRALNYASAGVGTTLHLAMEMLKLRAGIELLHVAYKDAPAARVDLAAGRVQLMMDLVNTAAPMAQQGRIKILAAAGTRRGAALPQLPTVQESGVKGFGVESFAGVMAPRGTPETVIEALHSALAKALSKPDLRESWIKQGATVIEGTSAEFMRQIADDTARWSQVLRESGVKLN